MHVIKRQECSVFVAKGLTAASPQANMCIALTHVNANFKSNVKTRATQGPQQLFLHPVAETHYISHLISYGLIDVFILFDLLPVSASWYFLHVLFSDMSAFHPQRFCSTKIMWLIHNLCILQTL